MTHYSNHVKSRSRKQSVTKTPQTQPIPGREEEMVKNNAGGYVFKADMWKRLERFLIIGTEGGTYYVREKDLTKQNFDNLINCIKADGIKVVDTIVDVSDKGRAIKNDHAIFALAMCVTSVASPEVQKYAWSNLDKVCRIGSHLFLFNYILDQHRGWSPARRKAIISWYERKTPQQAALQIVKYQGRTTSEGDASSRWSHCDLIRLAHPYSQDQFHNALYDYATHLWEPEKESKIKMVSESTRSLINNSKELRLVLGHEKAKKAENAKDVIAIIEEYEIPRESIPSKWQNDPDVWKALLPNMPLVGLIRTLNRATSYGILKPMSKELNIVVDKLSDGEYIKKSRLHPLQILVAMKQYSAGRGDKGSLTWTPVQEVLDALDKAFYLSFGFVEPTNKKLMLCIDVSGSMSYNSVAGLTNFTCAEATALMALATAKVEKAGNYMIMGFSTEFRDLGISPNMRLDAAKAKVQHAAFGGTDPTVPIKYAIKNKIHVDCFIIYSDGEGWAGQSHVTEELKAYRSKINPDAKMINVNMAANMTRLGDGSDTNILDIAGFDSETPQLISSFVSI